MKKRTKTCLLSLASLPPLLVVTFFFTLWFIGLQTKPWVASIIQDREQWYAQVKWEMNHKGDYEKLEREAGISSPSFSPNKGAYPSILITRPANIDQYKQFIAGGRS